MAPELVPKGAETYRPKITYRPALAPLQGILCSVFIVVGLSVMLSASRSGVAGVAGGGGAVLFGAILVAYVISTRLVVDPDKLVLWSGFRRKATIPWSDVQGLTVGVARAYTAGYKCLLVVTSSGPVRVDGVVGSRTFVEKKIAEIEDLRRRYVKP
jgi:hypothetical protein